MATSPAENALTTLSWLKTRLGISDSSQDTLLNGLIKFASDELENACNRKFYREDGISEDLAGHGLPLLQVSRTPLLSITSITFNGNTVDSDNYEIHKAEAGQIRHDSGAWIWSPALIPNIKYDPLPGTERKYYTVIYNGGWITPNQADATSGLEGTFTGQTRTLPYEIEEACVDLCKAAYYGDKRDPMVQSEGLLSWKATYRRINDVTGDTGLPPVVQRVIRRYRRLA